MKQSVGNSSASGFTIDHDLMFFGLLVVPVGYTTDLMIDEALPYLAGALASGSVTVPLRAWMLQPSDVVFRSTMLVVYRPSTVWNSISSMIDAAVVLAPTSPARPTGVL